MNLRLDSATCDLLVELAGGKHINAFVEELIQQEVARRKGELIEGRLLPLLREMIRQEFYRVIAQLHTDLQEDLSRITKWHADYLRDDAKYRGPPGHLDDPSDPRGRYVKRLIAWSSQTELSMTSVFRAM